MSLIQFALLLMITLTFVIVVAIFFAYRIGYRIGRNEMYDIAMRLARQNADLSYRNVSSVPLRSWPPRPWPHDPRCNTRGFTEVPASESRNLATYPSRYE